MTREEAIKLIDDRMCFARGKWSEHHMPEIDDYWNAGKMAIKALEQPESCRGCKHEPRYSHEEPCGSCSNNYVNKYERKEYQNEWWKS